ncbi:MAG TPA: hypothetical protein VEI06_06150 [Gemmatimonadaceae bacterium]|nr:hypothetical protein [Gemmatimonadaceae bacterium]
MTDQNRDPKQDRNPHEEEQHRGSGQSSRPSSGSSGSEQRSSGAPGTSKQGTPGSGTTGNPQRSSSKEYDDDKIGDGGDRERSGGKSDTGTKGPGNPRDAAPGGSPGSRSGQP